VSEPRIIYRLTNSQRMALQQILLEHMRCPNASASFIDCSISPPRETTYKDLLLLFSENRPMERE
jgi:hypothetical protein